MVDWALAQRVAAGALILKPAPASYHSRDLQGQFDELTARAELLASQWAQRATRVTLVQDVAQAYFQLRSLDAQLEITRSTIKARQDSLQLTQSLEQ